MSFRNVIVLLAVLLITGCNAPRQNPFDAQTENYHALTTVRITVHHLYPPKAPIGNVALSASHLKLFGETSSDGIVEWAFEPTDSIVIVSRADGYFADTTSFVLDPGINNLDIYLNAKPEVSDEKIFSIRKNSSNATDIVMQASITDPDGITDISNVNLHMLASDLRIPLSPNVELNRYQVQFNKSQIPGDISDDQVPEKKFELIVHNINGDSLAFGPFSVLRVIQDQLLQSLPNPNRPESGDILFTWTKIELDYPFFYRVILYRFDNNQKVGEFAPIDPAASQYDLTDSTTLNDLTAGLYVWILQVEDEFGDIGQSGALTFDYLK